MIYQLGDKKPEITGEVFIAESADIIGDVELHDGVNVWFGAVIRGDVEKITIGKNSNVQDNATVHTDFGLPCIIGENVTVGHNAILHSCVTHKIPYEEGVLILGSPAKVVRKMTEEEKEHIKKNGQHYVENGKLYIKELKKI